MGERPEVWVCLSFRVTPEESIPQRAGAGEQGMFQHINGRTELPPQSSAQRRLHQVFSHTVSSFFFFSRHVTTKSGKMMSSYQPAVEKCADKSKSNWGRLSRLMCIDKPSPNVKPESHDPPPLCAWGERQWSRSRGAESEQPRCAKSWEEPIPGEAMGSFITPSIFW